MRQRHLETLRGALKWQMISWLTMTSKARGLSLRQKWGEGKLPPATGRSESDFPVKMLLPLPVEPAPSFSIKCISEEGGKEFEGVKMPKWRTVTEYLDVCRISGHTPSSPAHYSSQTLQSTQVMTGETDFLSLDLLPFLSLQQTFCNQRACQERQEPLAEKKS